MFSKRSPQDQFNIFYEIPEPEVPFQKAFFNIPFCLSFLLYKVSEKSARNNSFFRLFL